MQSRRRLVVELRRLFKANDAAGVEALVRGGDSVRLFSAAQGLVTDSDPAVKWGAVRVGGAALAELAENDLVVARKLVRRLLWNLTEESGGCPWGAPELLGEALAASKPLAVEFAAILVSYINPEGNYLEHEPLLCGALWGIKRVAGVNPTAVGDAISFLPEMMRSGDGELRRLAGELKAFLESRVGGD